jgi:hypothetical protein
VATLVNFVLTEPFSIITSLLSSDPGLPCSLNSFSMTVLFGRVFEKGSSELEALLF